MQRETCFFYSKTNSCRHGLECNKSHPRVSEGRSIVIKNMYLYPRNDPSATLSDRAIQLHLDLFYEDWFTEMALKYGYVTELIIASNSCHQLIGNVYIEFRGRSSAARCHNEVNRRSYCRKKVVAEFGVAHRISSGICVENSNGLCSKRGQCNFIHPAPVSKELVDELKEAQDLMEGEQHYEQQHSEEHKRRKFGER
jgi:splicing factor U2AF 35 kDa subunit